MLLQNKQVFKSKKKKKSPSSYSPCGVTYLEQDMAWAGQALH